jgi:hypothetical protein
MDVLPGIDQRLGDVDPGFIVAQILLTADLASYLSLSSIAIP